MKIFITGATGFIGKSLCEFYTSKGETVIEYNRNKPVEDQLDQYKPDVIINCAAEIYDESKMIRPNILLVVDILEWLQRNKSTKLIQIGSSSEYGLLNKPSSEVDKINPYNAYEATKGSATLLCQGYARQFDLNIVIARVYSCFGPHERPRRLFPHLYNAFFKNKPMTLYKGNHDFIYIDDFIRGIDLLINSTNGLGEIVNFGSGIQTSNLQVLMLWQIVTGKMGNVTYKHEFSKPEDSNCWCCNTDYALEAYGFETKISVSEGIQKFIKNYEQITKTNS